MLSFSPELPSTSSAIILLFDSLSPSSRQRPISLKMKSAFLFPRRSMPLHPLNQVVDVPAYGHLRILSLIWLLQINLLDQRRPLSLRLSKRGSKQSRTGKMFSKSCPQGAKQRSTKATVTPHVGHATRHWEQIILAANRKADSKNAVPAPKAPEPASVGIKLGVPVSMAAPPPPSQRCQVSQHPWAF